LTERRVLMPFGNWIVVALASLVIASCSNTSQSSDTSGTLTNEQVSEIKSMASDAAEEKDQLSQSFLDNWDPAIENDCELAFKSLSRDEDEITGVVFLRAEIEDPNDGNFPILFVNQFNLSWAGPNASGGKITPDIGITLVRNDGNYTNVDKIYFRSGENLLTFSAEDTSKNEISSTLTSEDILKLNLLENIDFFWAAAEFGEIKYRLQGTESFDDAFTKLEIDNLKIILKAYKYVYNKNLSKI
jgi:hypothetical protein